MIQLILEAVKPIAQATVNNSNDTLEILTKINEFYDSAWNKLVLTGVFAFTIIGVIVPYFLDRHQKKVLKLSEEKFETQMNNQIEEAKKTIEKEVLEKLLIHKEIQVLERMLFLKHYKVF